MSAPAVASPCLAHGCALCCYETEMPLTGEDVARLEALGHDRAAFSIRGADGLVSLRTRDEDRKPCFFLKDDKCSVYADRPAGCRIYPLVLNAAHKVVRDEDCPHRREFPMDPAAKRRIERVLTAARKLAEST